MKPPKLPPRMLSGTTENLRGFPQGRKSSPLDPSKAPRRLARGLRILYEDDSILVVDKPAGLLSIGTETEREHTAHWILSVYLRKRGEKRNVAVVHRLDRDTSGVLLFAKSAATKKTLMEHWDDLVLRRQYVAVVEGVVQGEEGTIDLPLRENRGGRMVVDPQGQRAVTHWKVLQRGPRRTLLSLELETGRKNQIRIHLAAIGHPVVGDQKYGNQTQKRIEQIPGTTHSHYPRTPQDLRRDNRNRGTRGPVQQELPSEKRLLLHAEGLSFYHPISRALMEFSVPPPLEFRRALLRE